MEQPPHPTAKWCSILLVLILRIGGCTPVNYEIIGDEKTMAIECDGMDNEGDIQVRQILDMSDVRFVIADDLETLYYSGDIKVLMDIPQSPITLQMDVFRWVRSEWLPTPFSIKRDDFCKALLDPWEFWHPVVRELPKSQLNCPPNKSHVYSLRNISNHLFVNNMPSVDIAGDLKAVVHLSTDQHKTCMVVFVKVYAN
ncbi:uncharacterized protein LOC111081689 [Drosophila obscura]|uniref:uncharacterized protein LOC111081689 n=1 Tax=Drosophila obscura TaxID=7282 RepID=UPI001BB22F9A|nr:uncharacterized protein LOC111081689 [Drosophila obscura]